MTDVDRFLPVKPVVFQILLALAEAPSHGYAIIQAVRAGSRELIRLETGAFYRHLRKLLNEGLVAETTAGKPEDDDPRRGAYYGLTALGRAVLRAESERMAGLVAAARAVGVHRDGSNR